MKQVHAFAVLHGEKVANPADGVGAASIATFVPKDRSLSPLEIRLMCRQMDSVARDRRQPRLGPHLLSVQR